MKRLTSLFILFFIGYFAYAQEQSLGGIVFDKETKQRLNRVSILNLRTQKAVFNNTKGEFFIDAKEGDLIISSLSGYKSDTIKVAKQGSLVIYLKRLSIRLPEVVFKDSVLSAKAKYEETKKEFNKIYRVGNNKDVLNIGPGGVGLGIDAIWNSISREGKNARRLMEIMERDYENAFIDQVFNRELVSRCTGLKGDRLLIFMLNFRPSYAFAIRANEYELISYIKQAYMKFSVSNFQDISGLKPIELH
ncbi:carboxypeptidase-like regulatory domain-containing protein [Pelobium sp.]|nr:hypothetical protein [Pelobium sp.]MDA9554963.1 carboxypeptidase-like regulatory domain-containing protein [Pelobium sp.]